MKMSFRERMVLSVIIFILVAGIGAYVVIVPAWQRMTAASATLGTKIQQKAELDEKLATKDDLEQQIKDAYKKGVSAGDFFLPEMKTYEIDQHLTPIFTKNEIAVKGVSITEATAEKVEFYTYELFAVDYELGTSSDINESRLHAVKGDTEYAVAIAYTPETLILNKVSFSVSGTFENYLIALDDFEKLNESVVVRAFGKESGSEEESTDEFVVYVYQLSEIQEPKL